MTTAQTPWLLGGNNVLSPGDFLGTTIPFTLELRTNNIGALSISGADQRVGINTAPGLGRLAVWETSGALAGDFINTTIGLFSNVGILSQTLGSSSLGVGVLCTATGNNIVYGGRFTSSIQPTTSEIYGIRAEVPTNPNLNDIAYAIWGQTNMTNGPTTAYAGFFEGKTWCTSGFWNGSDSFLKDDVSEVTSGLDLISLLKPKRYIFQQEMYPQLGLPSGYHYGFIALEIEEVLPELVGTAIHPAEYDDEGNIISEAIEMKGVNYDGLIPVLTSAIQELEARLVVLESVVANCCSNIGETKSLDEQISGNGQTVSLFPNPTGGVATIVIVGNSEASARIHIYDAQGRQVESFEQIPILIGVNNFDLDVQKYASGKYVVQVIFSGTTNTKMLIVK